MSITDNRSKPLTYLDFCKVSISSAWKYIRKPDDLSIVKGAFRCIKYDLQEILIFILSYLFSLIYLLLFPITSSIIYLIHIIRKEQLYRKNR